MGYFYSCTQFQCLSVSIHHKLAGNLFLLSFYFFYDFFASETQSFNFHQPDYLFKGQLKYLLKDHMMSEFSKKLSIFARLLSLRIKTQIVQPNFWFFI